MPASSHSTQQQLGPPNTPSGFLVVVVVVPLQQLLHHTAQRPCTHHLAGCRTMLGSRVRRAPLLTPRQHTWVFQQQGQEELVMVVVSTQQWLQQQQQLSTKTALAAAVAASAASAASQSRCLGHSQPLLPQQVHTSVLLRHNNNMDTSSSSKA